MPNLTYLPVYLRRNVLAKLRLKPTRELRLS